MDTNQKLIQWNSRWLMLGDFIACKECLLPQQVNDADLPFEHDESCENNTGRQLPWAELHLILSDLPKREP